MTLLAVHGDQTLDNWRSKTAASKLKRAGDEGKSENNSKRKVYRLWFSIFLGYHIIAL